MRGHRQWVWSSGVLYIHGVDFYHNRVDILASGRFFSTESILQTIKSNVAQIESIIITIEPILSRIESFFSTESILRTVKSNITQIESILSRIESFFFSTESFLRTVELNVAQIESILITIDSEQN